MGSPKELTRRAFIATSLALGLEATQKVGALKTSGSAHAAESLQPITSIITKEIITGALQSVKQVMANDNFLTWQYDPIYFDTLPAIKRETITSQNLQTAKPTIIKTDEYLEAGPRISDDNIVFITGARNEPAEIHVYNLAEKTDRLIAKGTDTDKNPLKESPCIASNTVAWIDYRSGTPEIYGYDLSTQKEFLIDPNDKGDNRNNLTISGNVIAWNEAQSNGQWGLIAYDMVRHKTLLSLFKSGINLYNPYLSQDKIVYIQDIIGTSQSQTELFVFSLNTNSQQQLDVNKPSIKFNPVINGDWVAWIQQEQNGNFRIMANNLRVKNNVIEVMNSTTGQEPYQLYVYQSPQNESQVSIAWASRNKNTSFSTELEPIPATTNISITNIDIITPRFYFPLVGNKGKLDN